MNELIFLGGEDVSARIEISKKFMALGYEVEIIGTEKEDKFIGNGVTYQKYSLDRELNIINDIKTIFELRDILKSKKEGSTVHAFDTKPTMYLPLSAIGLKNIKVVRTITGMGRIFTEESFKNSVLKFIYNIIQKLVNLRVDFTIFQNSDDYDYFIKNGLLSEQKAEIIKSSGIDLAKFQLKVDSTKLENLKSKLELKKDKKTFILVSRMVKQKGILNYLEAAKLCYENGSDFNFLLVGQLDSDESITLDEIQEYQKYVKYLGRREDVKELLAISDIFVLPTYYREGVPRVLLEASAMGLGLIATDMPGCKDVVVDEFNGKRVKIKDSQDLYEKMKYLGSSDELLEKFSKNAKEKVKEFDLNRVVSKYSGVYKKL